MIGGGARLSQSRQFAAAAASPVIVAICVLLGAFVVHLPIAIALTFVVVGSAIYLFQLPRPVVAAFLVFLALQDPFRFLAGGEDTALGWFVKRADELFLVALAGWALLTSEGVHTSLRAKAIGLLVAACFGGMLLSSIVAGCEPLPAAMDFLLFSKPFLLFVIGASLQLSAEELLRGLRMLLPAMLVVILFAIVFLVMPSLQDAYIGDFRRVDIRLGMTSAQSFFDGPGPFAWFCAATFAVSYAAYLTFNRFSYAVAAVIAAVFTLLSWRRKSILGIAAMMLVAMAIRGGLGSSTRRKALVAVGLAAALALTTLAPMILDLWGYTVREYADNTAANARIALHVTAVKIARDRFPLGTGLASFASHASRVYYSNVYHEYGISNVWGLGPQYPAFITDTFWPMVLGQGGVLTLIPYVLFLFLLVSRCWQGAITEPPASHSRFICLAALFLLVGSLCESTSSHIYDSTMHSALALIPAGIAWSQIEARKLA